MRAARKAYWRFGGSATPYREDGADLMIQALFGRKLVNITPSYLIERDFLVRPHIFNVKMDAHFGDFFTYSKIYKHWIVENDPLNKLVATTMKYLENAGVSTLTLVQRYEHGERLQALLPGIPFIRGDMPRKERKKLIQDLKSGAIKSCIATTLADEGLDVKRLGAVLIPGGGKSITRVYQRVGRVLRPFEADGIKKTHAVAVLFQHDARFLKEHGSRVRKLMEEEPAFIIKSCKPYELLNEISSVVSPQETLFGDLW
jgi:superfamily II DNA or RNA helicase